MSTIILGIHGGAGRLGQRILALAQNDARFTATAVVVRADSAMVGRDVGVLGDGAPTGILISGEREALKLCDVVIDVSNPKAGAALAEYLASQNGPALVTGVTGWREQEEITLRRASQTLALLHSGNFSLGMTALLRNVRDTAARLGQGWGVHIHDSHHSAKKDAPSGTALMLARAVGQGWGRGVEPNVLPIGAPVAATPGAGEICISVSRKSDVIGTHHVSFIGPAETLQLGHEATSRDVFAKGALAAALWLSGKGAGFYGMDDVKNMA